MSGAIDAEIKRMRQRIVAGRPSQRGIERDTAGVVNWYRIRSRTDINELIEHDRR